jgi:hypothetical protein
MNTQKPNISKQYRTAKGKRFYKLKLIWKIA